MKKACAAVNIILVKHDPQYNKNYYIYIIILYTFILY